MSHFIIDLFVFCFLISQINGAPKSSKISQSLNDLSNGIKIIGGIEADKSEFPFIVGIRKEPEHMCGGVIINKDWVLTAAHCTQGHPSVYTLVAGDHYNDQDEGTEQSRSVLQIVNHPHYNAGKNENDMSLMQVTPSFKFNKFVQPVELVHRDFIYSEETMLVAGWGYLDETGRLSNTLMKVEVPFVPEDKCKIFYGENRIKDTMICAGEAGKDACKGDSGGPLLCQDREKRDHHILCGVVAFGTGCARPDKPGVYTKVNFYKDWIESTTHSIKKL